MAATVRIEQDGLVATVLLDRPAKHNALTPEMFVELEAALGELAGDASVRALRCARGLCSLTAEHTATRAAFGTHT